ncbi:murein transglycosylase A [Pseudorhodobacter sp.]|uniref:murein transglycosylase A n=1 Tax=Pseudorhodobacter sp. TaxID=1934400 RepID=UPI002647BF42|nr:murein transglycosylase A [Pseudorhodobacter sp.]MDN5787642.1 murein transglycosylase A [Pseudorhodobacter sp.]
MLALGLTMGSAAAQMLDFSDLDGWRQDDHRAALATFLDTCSLLTDPDWTPICRVAPQAMKSESTARSFFEMLFRPVMVGEPPALFTGYYEPELTGSLVQTPRFSFPLYARPPEVRDGEQWLDRSAIETSGALRGRGLEIVWLEDRVEVFFLQVQGSGRIRLANGGVLRVGYGGRNGHPYRSVGKELVRLGIMGEHDVSAQGIKAWVRSNPGRGAAMLRHNPSFVFFRRLPDLPPEKGPIGAMGRSITTMRSLAVDPAFTPLGAPIWLEKNGRAPIRRLMIAQDTGGAIKGAQRADIFYGTGAQAGENAGAIKDSGRMVLLLPIERAFAVLEAE